MRCEIAVCWYVNACAVIASTIEMGLGGKCGQCRVWIVRNAECRKCGERKMPGV